MGLFDKIFANQINKKAEAEVHKFFQAFTAYSPIYTTFEGGLYEMELVRSVIHAFAEACSKLKPKIKGTAYKSLEKTLQFKPNPFMTTSRFLYRAATILEVNNNAFIIPIEDEYGAITGYYPLLPTNCEVLDVRGTAYLRYTFASGQRAAIELEKVGVLTKFQYNDDFFGSDNSAIRTTMQVIHAQNQGIINGLKNSAVIRFLAKITRAVKDEDMTKARQKFTEDNLSAENHGGVMVYDGKFDDVKAIDNKPLNVNPAQMKEIKENVFNYFGSNENILQNKFDEEGWNAYYQGKIEPFSLQLSLAMSAMTYTNRELAYDNMIVFAMNNLQYASNQTRLNIATSMFDRGLMNRDMIMDMFNEPHVEGGHIFYIRKEYSQIDKLHDDPDKSKDPVHDDEFLEDVARAYRMFRKRRKINAKT